jgi:hypothetical protein
MCLLEWSFAFVGARMPLLGQVARAPFVFRLLGWLIGVML